eukprot:1150302-Pelagomonas_calceolata.AAC.2
MPFISLRPKGCVGSAYSFPYKEVLQWGCGVKCWPAGMENVTFQKSHEAGAVRQPLHQSAT